MSHEPRLQEISDALAAKGYHPFSAPCGILLDEADRARSACIRCAWCDGYPCLVHAKSDAEVIAVRPVLDHPNVTLLVNAEVVKVETDAGGHVATGVVVDRAGEREAYAADIVVVSAGASNSAKLLLNSANEAHPRGLANGSDQVGRNYMFHNCKAAVSISKERNDTVFQKTLGINDFYLAGEDRPWPLGNIQMVGKSNAGAMKGEEPKLTLLAPRWSLDDVAHHSVDWWLTTEDLPKPDNRVTVDDDGTRPSVVHVDQRQGGRRPLRRAEDHPQPRRHGRSPRARQELLHVDERPHRRRRPPGRHLPVRQRSRHIGTGRELQGARARQPLCGRHQLLPQHRCGEPGTHGHGERSAGRCPPDGAAPMTSARVAGPRRTTRTTRRHPRTRRPKGPFLRHAGGLERKKPWSAA